MKTHGLARTREFSILRDMKARCYNPSRNRYANYGGRGIKVCDRWLYGDGVKSGIECFVADMGMRPSPEHSIERRDNNGNYDPSNCYWATRKEQARNKRRTRFIEVSGKVMPLTEAIEVLGVNVHREIVASRLSRGWSVEDALKPPTYQKSAETRRKMSEAAKRRSTGAA